MQKIRVAVFFGNVSPEHEVSCSSAEGIIQNIDRSRFSVKEIYIDKKGRFLTGRNVLKSINCGEKNKLSQLNLNKLIHEIDVAFPVLHGQGGEDGAIQGFLQTLGIPFVGASVLASALCLDKTIFNQLMVVNKIFKPKFIILDNERQTADERIWISKEIKKLQLPLFVKPARAGSSVGISKVKHFIDLKKAILKAKNYDQKIIIEESVEDAIEIEVSVFGNTARDVKVSLPGRIIPGAEFYTYNDKYKDNKTRFELPARLSKRKIAEIRRVAKRAYLIANCQGLARVDFLLNKDKKVYLNEINTLPGFTSISMYPKLWRISGLSFRQLLTKLIHLALKRKT